MADSVNLLMVKLENAMLNQLISSSSVNQSSSDDTGLSFENLLSSALGDSASTNQLSDTALSDTDGIYSDSLYGTAGAASSTDGIAGGMSASDNLVQFIENHEGFSATPYSGIDSWNETTGYGHVIEPGENLANVTLTQSQAQDLLKSDLKTYEASVNKEFEGTKLTQNQFDSLVSFSYNLGSNIWSKVPNLVSDVKSGASSDVIKEDFAKCANCGGKLEQGLVNRRLDEWQVYSSGDYTS